MNIGSELSVKRNPLLAQLMYYVKDIENFGTGIKKIYNACEAAGVKVEYEMRKFGLAVIFHRPNISVFGDGIGDGSITNSITNSIIEDITLNDTQKTILVQMQENPKTSTKDLAEILGIADRNVKNHIKFLKQGGFIERVGSPKGGHWIILREGGGKSNG